MNCQTRCDGSNCKPDVRAVAECLEQRLPAYRPGGDVRARPAYGSHSTRTLFFSHKREIFLRVHPDDLVHLLAASGRPLIVPDCPPMFGIPSLPHSSMHLDGLSGSAWSRSAGSGSMWFPSTPATKRRSPPAEILSFIAAIAASSSCPGSSRSCMLVKPSALTNSRLASGIIAENAQLGLPVRHRGALRLGGGSGRTRRSVCASSDGHQTKIVQLRVQAQVGGHLFVRNPARWPKDQLPDRDEGPRRQEQLADGDQDAKSFQELPLRKLSRR